MFTTTLNVLAVWNKGAVIDGYSPELYRLDDHGNVMKYSEHGNRDSKYGWEIDHIIPVSRGGSDNLSNLRPLNWLANIRRN